MNSRYMTDQWTQTRTISASSDPRMQPITDIGRRFDVGLVSALLWLHASCQHLVVVNVKAWINTSILIDIRAAAEMLLKIADKLSYV